LRQWTIWFVAWNENATFVPDRPRILEQTTHFQMLNALVKSLFEYDLRDPAVRKDEKRGEAWKFFQDMNASGLDRTLIVRQMRVSTNWVQLNDLPSCRPCAKLLWTTTLTFTSKSLVLSGCGSMSEPIFPTLSSGFLDLLAASIRRELKTAMNGTLTRRMRPQREEELAGFWKRPTRT